eukprot:153513_1
MSPYMIWKQIQDSMDPIAVYYCYCCAVLDLLLVYAIFTQKEDTLYKMNKSQRHQSLNANVKSRWDIIIIRLEKSPFVVLSIYSTVSSIIGFAVVFSCVVNLFLGGVLNAATEATDLPFFLWTQAVLTYFYIYYCALPACQLSWYNYADTCVLFRIGNLNVITGHVWRGIHLLFCLGQMNSGHGNMSIGNWNYQIRVLCRWMLFQGLTWIVVYVTIHLVAGLYLWASMYAKFIEDSTQKWVKPAPHISMLDISWITFLLYSIFTSNYTMQSLILWLFIYIFIKSGNYYLNTTFPWFSGKYTYDHNGEYNRDNMYEYWQKIIINERKQYELKKRSSIPMYAAFAIFIVVIAGTINTMYSDTIIESVVDNNNNNNN